MQPGLPLWEGPNWVYCRASRRCLKLGKVMGVRYPGPVSRHNLVCPLLLYPDCPRLGPFCHGGGRFATTVVVGAFGRHGATHDLAQRGVGRSGQESVMAVDRFC